MPLKKNSPAIHRSSLPNHRTKQAILVAALSLFAGAALMDGILRMHRSAHLMSAKRKTAPNSLAMTSAQADKDNAEFELKRKNTEKTEECVPMRIRQDGAIGISYLNCSRQAYDQDGEAVTITDDFRVPSELARRYNFWRRIYSLWSKDHYVLHLSEYPEVVIAIFDASKISALPVAKDKKIKKFAKVERDNYRKLFLAMHQNRENEERFTPAMRRLAENMIHINNTDKYLVAAQSLRLQRGQRDFIASGLAVAPKYLSSIEAEFRRQGVPVEITRLAFVESSFNLKAQSKVGASGVYQIMPATGHQYLRIFDGVDERNDPIKASRAAAKLLRLNYNLTGAWPLAITAYNHGVGGIRRATQAVDSHDIADLIDKYHGNQFGFASKNFYSSFLGVLATLKDADRLFPEVPRVQPLAFSTIKLSKPISVREICRKNTVSLAQVAQLNPDISPRVIRSESNLPTGFVIKIPVKTNITSRTFASRSTSR